jgi:hypothetical protein
LTDEELPWYDNVYGLFRSIFGIRDNYAGVECLVEWPLSLRDPQLGPVLTGAPDLAAFGGGNALLVVYHLGKRAPQEYENWQLKALAVLAQASRAPLLLAPRAGRAPRQAAAGPLAGQRAGRGKVARAAPRGLGQQANGAPGALVRGLPRQDTLPGHLTAP